MVKTLKRISKKSYRTLLHRRKINNKLRSKKNGVSKRYSKKAVLKQKGGVTQSIQIKVYIVYEKGKYKGTDDKVTDGEFTILPITYDDKLAFVKQMSKLDMRNIIGILYKKDENDWVFSGLNYKYEESVIVQRWIGDTQVDLDEKLEQHKNAKRPPYKMKLEKYKLSDDNNNSQAIKKAIIELCGIDNKFTFPDNFFTQMNNHSHFSCWIRLQKKGVWTMGMKGTGTHKLTSFVYSREGDTSKTTLELSDRDDIFSEYNEIEKKFLGKVKTGDSSILITPGNNNGKMVVDSPEAADIIVKDGDVLFMPYVTTKHYGDYCSDEKRKVDQQGRNKCEALPLDKVYDEKKFEFPGRPIRDSDKGKFTYSKRGEIAVSFDFSKPFDAEIEKHMLSKLEEFCDFIIASKAVELKTAYVKQNWVVEAQKDKKVKNAIFRLYEYSDIRDIYNPGEFKNFLGDITEEVFKKKKEEEKAIYNSAWESTWGSKKIK